MSSFYDTLDEKVAEDFRRRKRTFKRNKSYCNLCGRRLYTASQKVVDHIIPVSQISDERALYDTSNWQVICHSCKQRKDRQDNVNY